MTDHCTWIWRTTIAVVLLVVLSPMRVCAQSHYSYVDLGANFTGLSAAYCANDSGHAVGVYYLSGSSGPSRAFFWPGAGAPRDIPGLGGASAQARALNSTDDVAGSASLPTGASHGT